MTIAPRLTWQHTEFGRRSTCERFHIVHAHDGWALLDADWNPIAAAATIAAAQQRAEQLAARAAASGSTTPTDLKLEDVRGDTV